MHQERSAGKVMMIIFRNQDGVLLTEYLPRGTTISGPCYASIIERLHSVIVEKRRGKISHEVLLLYDNDPIHKCKIVQATIRQAGFIELNHPTYSLDIAPTNYHPLSNLKKFVCLKNFSSDDDPTGLSLTKSLENPAHIVKSLGSLSRESLGSYQRTKRS